MIRLDEIKNLPRSELTMLNVYTHMCLFPKAILKEAVVTEYQRHYSIRLCYESQKSGKSFAHTFNFWKLTEAKEAQKFLDLLSSYFPAIRITGTIHTYDYEGANHEEFNQ